ncbi:MAG: tandem-95 repeat protein [Opitutales bacterium]|nr:tandem-95 repeat protein [Opitutales bacterium]
MLYATDDRGRRSVETVLVKVAEPALAAYGVISLNMWADIHRDNIAWHEGAGAVSVNNWNNMWANAVVLRDHRGVVTPVVLTRPTGTHYQTDARPRNANEKLIMGHHATITGSSRTYRFSHIPYTQYDLYVYNGGAGSHGTPVRYSVGGESFYVLETDNVFDGVLSESLATTAGDAVEGNEYVVFRGLTLETVEIVVSGNPRAGPSGFQIVATGDGPVARPDFVQTEVDTPVDIFPLANDNGNNIALHSVGEPSAGSLEIIDGVRVRYTPPLAFNGQVIFDYSIIDDTDRIASSYVQIRVGTPNLPPVAVDDHASVVQGGSIVINVLANDYDPEGDPIVITGITQPAHGTAYILEDGELRYTPYAAFSGSDSFTYTIADSEGNVATANVFITVNPISVSDAISINTITQGNALSSNQTAGVVPRANWNNIGDGSGLIPLMGSDGLQTTASVTHPGGFRYNTQRTGDTADHLMMSGHAGNTSSTLQYHFHNIPFEAYDVYVYWGAHQDEWVPDFLRLTIGDQTFWIRVEDQAWNGTFVRSTATTKAQATTPASYVVFENLSSGSFTLTTVADTGNNRNRAGPAGIQIVARTPPPPDGPSYAAWLSDHGLDGLGNTGPGASFLNDGVPNLLKYFAGIAPTESLPEALRPRIESVTTPGGERLLFTFRTLADRTDVDWVVEESTDLVNWVPADSSFAESLFHEDGTVTHTIQSQPISPGTAAFLRLSMILFTDD